MMLFTQILQSRNQFPNLGEYLNYMAYPLWFFMLLSLLYSLYLVAYCITCIASLLLYIFKNIFKNYNNTDLSTYWYKPRQCIAFAVSMFGKIWHGYDVIGLEHLPKGPGIVVYYHGAAVCDYALFVAHLFQTGKLCRSIVDNILTSIPGIQLFLEVIGCKAYTKAECIEFLKNGDLLGIAPGGLREGNFSEDYNLIWEKRTGFAQVALDAKVPIIPMFTENIREGYITIGNSWLTKRLYEKTRLLFLPVIGAIPVKLCTYIGEPIPYDPNITVTELAEKAKVAIESLQNKYQKRPGSILRALKQRFDKCDKTDKNS